MTLQKKKETQKHPKQSNKQRMVAGPKWKGQGNMQKSIQARIESQPC